MLFNSSTVINGERFTAPAPKIFKIKLLIPTKNAISGLKTASTTSMSGAVASAIFPACLAERILGVISQKISKVPVVTRVEMTIPQR